MSPACKSRIPCLFAAFDLQPFTLQNTDLMLAGAAGAAAEAFEASQVATGDHLICVIKEFSH